MSISSPHPEPLEAKKPQLYRVGTLTYTKASLLSLFFWLLAGEVIYILLDGIEPKILPIILKQHGATDQQIAILISSVAAITNLIVNPVVSYRSDRKRSRWGRRIPYLFWATPFVSVFLALTPFAPEIVERAMRVGWIADFLRTFTWAPVIIGYAVLVVLYQLFQKIIGSVYFYLFRDVIPNEHMGRFLTFLRVFGALATFGLNYWLVGMAEQYSKHIFVGVAIFNLVGFMAMCWFVREGDYPPADEEPQRESPKRGGFIRGAVTFMRESYRSRIYWWTYYQRMMMFGAMAVSPFVILFARDELHINLDRVGKLMSWSAVIWLVVAYPVGWLLDRWGSIRMLGIALWMQGICAAASFVGVVGEWTFLTSSVIMGIAYWIILLAGFKLICDIFHANRMGQLASASILLQSIFIAVVVSPLAGWMLDTLKNFQAVYTIPLIGELSVQRYRFVFLMIAVMSFMSVIGLIRVKMHWLRMGGPTNYQPPAVTG